MRLCIIPFTLDAAMCSHFIAFPDLSDRLNRASAIKNWSCQNKKEHALDDSNSQKGMKKNLHPLVKLTGSRTTVLETLTQSW